MCGSESVSKAASEARTETKYVPDEAKVWLVVAPSPVAPSPKRHTYTSGSAPPSDDTENGAGSPAVAAWGQLTLWMCGPAEKVTVTLALPRSTSCAVFPTTRDWYARTS